MMNDFSEFTKSINSFTLTFKIPKVEAKYKKNRINPLSVVKSMRIALIILVALIVFRKIQTIIVIKAKNPTTTRSLTSAWIELTCTLVILALEFLFTYVNFLQYLRGFISLTYMFYSVTQSSYNHNSAKIYLIAMLFFL